MNYRFSELTKKTLMSFSVAALCGGFVACTDDYDLDDPGNYPSWLGNSIYEELKNPNSKVLTGTFNNYVKLIDDLGYAETLGKTGSKTIFPANDSAFARFYANNSWGVTKYEDLTESMKKLLLYNSMLDNAILVEMLSNISVENNSNVASGVALKHQTGINVIDSITHFYGPVGLPQNNSYWDKYYNTGIDLVMDATRPMMVHFTAEQMTANDITTEGAESDFAIITGSEYDDTKQTAYIFRDRIINPDITCKNGYIHQMEDVIVPPGNLAEMLRTNGETNYFSRMLDRFSAPFYVANVTNNYNDYAIANGLNQKDSIFEKSYMNERDLTTDPNGKTLDKGELLPYNPGWNAYYTTGTNSQLSDIAAMFVPSDKAMEKYFLPGGSGAFLIEQFGKKENNVENLMENIDSIPKNIVQAFVSMLMKSSFIASVPSKFDNVPDDSNDPMGLTTDAIEKKDGKYNVKIANNGVAYILNKVFAPNKYVAVSAPALLATDMRVMNWGIQNNKQKSTGGLGLGLNFYAYLLAMDANYGLFIPTDAAFDNYYVDPQSLVTQPRVLHYYYNSNKSPYIFCSSRNYDPTSGNVSEDSTMLSGSNFPISQFIDILNTHTIVLNEGETMGANHYYKTKNGGTIYFDEANQEVKSGSQINNGRPVSKFIKTYNQKNGRTYAIDHIIQMPQNSVYKTLSENNQYKEFFNLCNDDRGDEIREFAGISSKKIDGSLISPMTRFHTFRSEKGYYGLDYDVNYFNSYNYTVYAPNDKAMADAYSKGLPKWDELETLYKSVVDLEDNEENNKKKTQVKAEILAKVEAINDFIRYHFQNNSVYVDNTVNNGEYATACSDSLGIAYKLNIEGGSKSFTVYDAANNDVIIKADPNKMYNRMTRDYVFKNDPKDSRTLLTNEISTSSFAVVHEISTPLCPYRSGRYDGMWASANAKKRLVGHRNCYLKKQKDMYRK